MKAAVSERFCPACERSYHEGESCPTDGTPLISIGPGHDPMIGRTLDGRYTIHERLGAGGMGTVYRGTQQIVGRPVAIKVVGPGLMANPDAIKRFFREAKLASRLSHPHAVSMLDFGRAEDGVFYLVMEMLVGSTLDVIIKREGRMPLARAIGIAGQICDVLDEARRLSIIHRDLKPNNVMLLDGDRDRVKVLDFGLAKSLSADTTTAMSMTGTGALLGTPPFMSPEAALGLELDERSDLYSLGCLIYYLVSGRLAFSARTVQEVLALQISAPPPPLPEVPPEIDAVIMRLLEKEPDMRFATAAETRASLEAALAAAGGFVPPSRPPSRPVAASEPSVVAPSLLIETPPRRRARWRYAAITTVALAIGAGVGFVSLRLRGTTEAATDPAADAARERAPAVPSPATPDASAPTSSVAKQVESAAAAREARDIVPPPPDAGVEQAASPPKESKPAVRPARPSRPPPPRTAPHAGSATSQPPVPPSEPPKETTPW